MTKKDYIMIASVLKDRIDPYLEPQTSMSCYSLARGICDDLVSEFSKENPRFDRDKFLTACGFVN